MAIPSHGSRCSTYSRVVKPTPARRWPTCWASIVIPSDVGWRSTSRAVSLPCSIATCPLASRSRSRRPCLLRSRRPCGERKALPPIKPSESGSSRRCTSMSSITRSTPSCAPGSRPNSRCRGRATQKNPDAIAQFQATCLKQLQQAIPTENSRPLRVFSQDESRFGLLTVRRRRLTACGVQPIGTIQHVLEWSAASGPVAPTSGEHFFLELPYLNADNFQIFVDAFAQAYPDSLNILVLDKSGGHTALRLKLPDNVCLVFLPPYCPELNPIERLWRDLKDDLAWQ